MYFNNKLIIGKNSYKEVCLLPSMANRHGLITGASGTGKTITSKVMAESFSELGVPVFMADVKGDLAGTAVIGEMNDNISKRVENLELEGFEVKDFPVRFWDVYRENGHPIRFKVSDVGPNILSIMLGLSEAQEGVLNIVFKVAEEVNPETGKEKWDLDTLSDLKNALNYVGEHRNDYTIDYGNVNTQSIGVILRSLNALENQGLDNFFGEPDLNIHDFLSVDNNGQGVINILDAVKLYENPDLYSAVMLCLLTKLYNSMPEVGDLDKPKIVFFFDEAYFLFREMPPYRLKQIEKIVRLIRSKGIGLYFISHSTTDIPAAILEQLGNRIQHNLRAYTPADQKIAKAAADSFRTNPEFNTYDAILELGTGEAIISFQNEKGEPEICERATILPPQSKIGVIDQITRNKIINNSPFAGKYDEDVDDRSASEIIKEKREEENKIKEEKESAKLEEKRLKEEEKAKAKAEKEKNKAEREKKNTPQYKLGKKVVNKTTDKILNKVLNGIIKSIFK
jgi:hypothetical protein